MNVGDLSAPNPDEEAQTSTPRRRIHRHFSEPIRTRLDDRTATASLNNRSTQASGAIASPFLSQALMETAKKAKAATEQRDELFREKEEMKKGYIERNGVPIYRPWHSLSRFEQAGPLLGSGNFGNVRTWRHLLDRKFYAIKEIKVEKAFTDDGSITDMLVRAMQEVAHLASLSHANIVECKECWLEAVQDEPRPVHLYIQMELCMTSLLSLMQGRRLTRYMDEDGTLFAKTELRWSSQMAAGLDHLHSMGIIQPL